MTVLVPEPRDADSALQAQLAAETARRRTFAIISHPDAGKTTLTEKLLLYSGAIDLAGAVRTRKNQRHATSDWMAMERERGISISSTVLAVDYAGCRINLLDTPGHQDFSEDTYRTLMAVDSAVMVLDAAKGIEAQTRKLFEVCRMRGVPILTFINKLDQPGREPLDLLDEIERVLTIGAVPLNWPIGSGGTFQGVYDLPGRQVLRFERTAHGAHRAPAQVASLDDPALDALLGHAAAGRLRDDVTLLDGAGAAFDQATFLRGAVTPVFFGSALNNFGVEPFLQALVALAPPPGPRTSDRGPIDPAAEPFSGFVFKIQANMNPLHRDRMAFIRVCSGRFEKDMSVHSPRLGRSIRMTRPHRVFARERETVAEAFPGDVIGVTNPGLFAIGDTLYTGAPLQYAAIPRFAPERFAVLLNRSLAKHKQFHKGLEQLVEEGVVQLLYDPQSMRREPILAAVGELQFDVVRARMAAEYSVETEIEHLPYVAARWPSCPPAVLAETRIISTIRQLQDSADRPVLLFNSDWELGYLEREQPQLQLRGPVG
ncbi:peptide chain release factor 3 [Oscillochloris sp. ZM17-4]|uniref:peptide chain release factor 3 n=1 Tax=Oscillochloris sp. ZM17-4 TaxID=2866714 RepID=UPI001C72DC05|nr:peptide chain release factor 3 [Oscillochloris sp. ZM17-4]MBX0330725.1 peptide chain release factor 3 [Oscillochloris sp. ZM17-4]